MASIQGKVTGVVIPDRANFVSDREHMCAQTMLNTEHQTFSPRMTPEDELRQQLRNNRNRCHKFKLL